MYMYIIVIHSCIFEDKSFKGDKLWASMNEDFMTEESDDDTGDSFRQHHLKWRSNSMCVFSKAFCVFVGLNMLVKKLDKRL